MKKKNIEYNEDGAAPCKYCKRNKIKSYPYISRVDDLYYAKCPHCNHFDPYEFLGISKKRTIEHWNETMEAGVK
jgi:hypothetical protein